MLVCKQLEENKVLEGFSIIIEHHNILMLLLCLELIDLDKDKGLPNIKKEDSTNQKYQETYE